MFSSRVWASARLAMEAERVVIFCLVKAEDRSLEAC